MTSPSNPRSVTTIASTKRLADARIERHTDGDQQSPFGLPFNVIMNIQQPRFETQTQVDFVVIGAGAAGGIIAKELSTAGFQVVVLEQGPYLKEKDFNHDEIKHLWQSAL